MHGDRAISGVEYVLDDSIAMISKGDLDGKITYANRDFVQVSGYSEDQLLGAPQSLLAHPDTPREVFEDFLRTVGANKTWTGIAKGLRRNGDHFWVEMTAAPIHANHRTVGYITIRAKAAPEKVRLANQAYSAMKSGRADFALQGGTIVKRSPLTRARGLSRLSVATKMNVLTALTTVLCAGNLAALAYQGSSSIRWVISSSAASVACCLLSSLLFRRGVLAPFAQVKDHIDDLGEGNLSRAIEALGQDEATQIRHALRILQINLTLLVSQIKETTALVGSGVAEIASGNADLSARTEAQAASLTQIAASMAELTAIVAKNSESAREANGLSMTTSSVAAKGRQAVGKVIETMVSIEDSSRRIVDIIGVIDSIAFQTNILALNAAVEAARAGAQGRGFAVVAGEVRNLARRCADAAKEIKSLIGDSTARVETGSRLVSEAGATMTDIVAAVERVATVLNDISTASRTQSDGIAQVNEALARVEHTTERNARLVDQAGAGSRRMQEEAGKLAKLVEAFKLSSVA
ncbi:methyl-accepting chemotaxis protein [Trinickia sp.]|uniref:methyl-accepting chemotaxis protein n=1 Tax=Trinickia sp. TaxID=2571163 RepID=UPI003F7CE050